MWIGTRTYLVEVRDPDVEPTLEMVSWGSSSQYLNGGLGLVESSNGHREWFFQWSNVTRAEARKLTDLADGVYGPGPFHMVDKIAADVNVLPQSWAVPALGGYDAVPLVGEVRPVLSANTDQSQGYPAEKATYTVAADSTVRPFRTAIPPGYVAWVGIHGDAGAANRVKVTPFVGGVAGTKVNPTILSVSTPTRVNTMVEGDELELAYDVSSPGAAPLVGNIVQLLPDGVMPETGGFLSGQGHSGVKFMGRPVVVPNTVADGLELVSVSAKLGEVGQWLT